MAGTLIVSLDFELFWGMLDVCPLEEYEQNVLGGRKAIPDTLALFQKYGIHATWATVGFMFAENAQEAADFFPEESLRPTYDNPALKPYAQFAGIGSNEEVAPCFFAPSLIAKIAAQPGQEIASHTFSHYYCREEGQTPRQFAADMRAAKAIAEKHGYHLTSVVLPRDQCEGAYTKVLRDLGFDCYRGESDAWYETRKCPHFLLRVLRLLDTYFPISGNQSYEPKKEDGIWNLIGSQKFRTIFPPLKFLEGAKVRKIKRQMRYAAKHDLTYHLWWHPHNIGVDTQEHLKQLEDIFQYYQQLHETYGMESKNMKEAVQQAQNA